MKLFSTEDWDLKKDVFTIPNILSMVRILILPIYLKIILNATSKTDFYIAAGLILFSGLTDMLDGLIARKFNQITELGKLLDPVADKLTQLAIAISLVHYYPAMWLLVIVLVIKELFMLISGWLLLQYDQKLDGAKWFGKVSTAVFYASMFILLLFPKAPKSILYGVIGLTLFFLLLSFLLYGREYYYLFKEAKKNKHQS